MRKLIIPLLILLIIPFALADLIISPSSYDGSVYTNINKKAEIEIKNTFDFQIYNINFTPINYIDFPEIAKLNPNESKKINITVRTNTTFSKKTFNSMVKFWYYSDINPDPKTYQVVINNTEFIPSTITIKMGDRIMFNNTGQYQANVADDYSPYRYFDALINSNQTTTISTFNQIDDFTYTDWNIWKKGHIIVQNLTQELVNNPDYNKVFTISFDSKHVESEIGIEIYPENNLTMEYNENQEVNIRLWNKGNTTIYNITLKSDDYEDWFSFEKNNFGLTKNENKFIDLIISPKINKSGETNKTYTIEIIAEAENAQTISTELRIFIPFEGEVLILGNLSREELIRKIDELKKVLLDLNIVGQEPRVEIIYKNSTIELTKEEAIKNFRNINTEIGAIKLNDDKKTKSINAMDLSIQGLTLLLKDMNKTITEAKETSIESQDKADGAYRALLLFILLMVTVFFCAYGVHRIKIKKKKEINQEG